MDPVPGAELDFPDANDLLHFNVSVTPSDGLYRGATFKFAVEVPANYPYEPPKVACQTLVRTQASVSLHINFNYMISSGLSSKYRLGGTCVPQHLAGRLDARAQLGFCHIWTHDTLFGKPNRSRNNPLG